MSARKSYPKTHYVLGCIHCGKPLNPGKKLSYDQLIICRGCYVKITHQLLTISDTSKDPGIKPVSSLIIKANQKTNRVKEPTK